MSIEWMMPSSRLMACELLVPWPGTEPMPLAVEDHSTAREVPTVNILYKLNNQLSVQFSRSVMSDSMWPQGLQHTRLPCPSPTLGAYSNSCPSNWWCHPAISSSVIPFFSCPQSFPASGSFQMSQFFTSYGQSIGVSASTSVLPMNIQNRSPLGWTGWISFQPKGLSRVLSNTTVQKH